jgi:acyl carrier protein
LEKTPEAFFVSLSSANGLAGSYGAGAYSAANAFLESLACLQRQQGRRAHCLAFSRWDRVGMSREYQPPEVIRARGYYSLRKEQALRSLFTALTHDEPLMFVGLDDTNKYVRRYLLAGDVSDQRLVAFVPTSRLSELSAAQLTVEDRFGVPVPVDVRDRRELPRAESDADSPIGQDSAPPATDAERLVAEVWCRVLSLGTVGAHDNFFDLGGTSLDVARIASELGEALRRPVTTTDVYQYSTVAALAAHFAGADAGQSEVAESSRRGGARREAVRARAALSRAGR